MQGLKTLVFLVVVVALLGLTSSAPTDEEYSGLERMPAMMVRSGPAELWDPAARACTTSACRSLCRSLGWNTGFCLDAVWCVCHN